jgi:hypothetical protein
MTNRIDHTHCTHSRTPEGRKYCRNARVEAIRAAQKAYMDVDAGTFPAAEYEAMVDLMVGRWFDTHDEAYNAVERGPMA